MNVEEGEEVATVETTPPPAPEAGSSSQESAPERDFEAEARADGWVPEEEFRGTKRPTQFLSAEEFVKRGEEFAPFRKRTEKAVEDRVSKMEKMFEKTITRLKAQHEKEMSDLKAAKKDAIKAGNPEEVERIEAAMETLSESAPDKQPTKSNDDVQAEWVAANPWFEKDEDLATLALGYSNKIRSADLSLEENLKRTEEYIKKKFPEKFGGRPAANAHAAVDGGGHSPGGLKSDPLARLPAEARAQAKADMAKFPKIYPNAVAWVKAYEA